MAADGDADSVRMTPRAYARRNRRLLFGIGFLLGLVIIALRHGLGRGDVADLLEPQAQQPAETTAQTAAAEPLKKAAGIVDESLAKLAEVVGVGAAPGVTDVQLVRQGYYEAIVRVRYTAKQAHQSARGYLYLHERDHPRGTGVGAFVKAGEHAATLYVNRRLAHKGPYVSGQFVALMYRYGSKEPPFFEQDVPLSLQWPGLREVGVQRRVERYPDVRRLELYRNIPRYEEFALKLVERGFPAGAMTILYAPCAQCRAGLHIGPRVRIEVLQELLAALQEHGTPVQWVDYDARPMRTGYILLGWTPTGQARPLWKHIDRLLQDGLTIREFFDIVGLEPS